MTAIEWNQRTIEEFHRKRGRGVGPWRDNLLLLTAKGARSGDEITTPLVYRKDGNHYVVVASKGGAPDHPKWLHNLEANPTAEIEVANDNGLETFKARAKPIMSGPEHDRLYEYMTEVWPSFRDYQQRTERTIPVVVLERLPD
jgi:deazaflavin-dependent oxidoreductase (nitroreductase family)